MEKPRLPQAVCASSCSSGMAANKQQHSMVLILLLAPLQLVILWFRNARDRGWIHAQNYTQSDTNTPTQRWSRRFQINHFDAKIDFFSFFKKTFRDIDLWNLSLCFVWIVRISGAFQLITVCKVRLQSEPKCECLLGNTKGRIPGQAVITINIPQRGFKTHKFAKTNWDHIEMNALLACFEYERKYKTEPEYYLSSTVKYFLLFHSNLPQKMEMKV